MSVFIACYATKQANSANISRDKKRETEKRRRENTFVAWLLYHFISSNQIVCNVKMRVKYADLTFHMPWENIPFIEISNKSPHTVRRILCLLHQQPEIRHMRLGGEFSNKMLKRACVLQHVAVYSKNIYSWCPEMEKQATEQKSLRCRGKIPPWKLRLVVVFSCEQNSNFKAYRSRPNASNSRKNLCSVDFEWTVRPNVEKRFFMRPWHPFLVREAHTSLITKSTSFSWDNGWFRFTLSHSTEFQ